jgi:hypothetical protein
MVLAGAETRITLIVRGARQDRFGLILKQGVEPKMKKISIVIVSAGVLVIAIVLGVFVGRASAQAKPVVSIRADFARFNLDGSRLTQTASKRLMFVTLQYNDAKVPCVVVDTLAGTLSNENVGGASVSCGWSQQAIEVLTAAAPAK